MPTASEPYAHQAALQHLLERGFVMFHPMLGEKLGHKAAIFLGLALYWTRHGLQKQPGRHGWFYMSSKQWETTTGLTSREQASARSDLVHAGILQESRPGQGPMHYRVRLDALSQWLGIEARESAASAPWTLIPSWFRNCVSFYKPLADVAGSVAGGLYLSYLLQAQRQALDVAPSKHLAATTGSHSETGTGFLSISQDEIANALCLGPKVQRNARERLRSAGFVREVGASMLSLNLPAIVACLHAQERRPLRERLARPQEPVDAVSKGRRLAQTSVAVDAATKVDPLTRQLPLLPVLPVPASAGTGEAARVAPEDSRSLAEQADATLRTRRLVTKVLGAGVPPIEAQVKVVDVGNRHQGMSEFSHRTHRISEPIGAFSLRTDAASVNNAVAENAYRSAAELAENAHQPDQPVAENADQSCRFVGSWLPKTQLHITNTNTNTTTKRVRGTGPVDKLGESDESASRRRRQREYETNPDVDASLRIAQSAQQAGSAGAPGPLIFPSLHPELLPGLRHVLRLAPVQQHQALLDELDGQLHIQGKVIHNPAGWLHGLIKSRQSSNNEGVLALAGRVAAEREHREQIAIQVARAAQGQTQSSKDAVSDQPVDPEKSRAHKERLAVLRAEFAQKAAVLK